jgi:N-acyl-D-aspartate/D-glutamate deacylase
MTFDTLILNATVVDGTGRAGFRGDLGIFGHTIDRIGALADAQAAQRIDASGQVVAPGFIDMHTHSDVTLLDEPGGESKAYQGVTTEVIGNCGFSPFPAGPAGVQGLRDALGSFLPSRRDWGWSTLDGWAQCLESNGISLNVAPLVGHATLRVAAGATENRVPAADQMRTMKNLTAEAAAQGAFGLSTGLTLPPSSYAATDEVVELAKVFGTGTAAFYATHARLWANWHVKAVEEAAEIGRRSGLPVQYAHIAIIDAREYGNGGKMLSVIEKARDEGVDFTCDVYPYTAAGTNLSQLIPGWVQEGGVSAMLARLRDPQTRARALRDTRRSWFDGLPWDWDSIVVSYIRSQGNQKWLGMSMADISRRSGLEPAAALLQLIDEEDNYVGALMHNRKEADVRYFLTQPMIMVGSDGRAITPHGLYAKDRPHPRFYGTFPRVLGRYVRDEKVLSLEAAIHKMTGLPARRLGLTDRGRIAEGLVADLVVFDPRTIIDRATFDDPHRYAEGISHLFVSGKAVIANGRHTGARPGKVLRRER